jgi:hypothetical protein
MKILGTIIGVLLILLLGFLSIVTCVLSSQLEKYEDLDRGDPKEGGSNE